MAHTVIRFPSMPRPKRILPKRWNYEEHILDEKPGARSCICDMIPAFPALTLTASRYILGERWLNEWKELNKYSYYTVKVDNLPEEPQVPTAVRYFYYYRYRHHIIPWVGSRTGIIGHATNGCKRFRMWGKLLIQVEWEISSMGPRIFFRRRALYASGR